MGHKIHKEKNAIRPGFSEDDRQTLAMNGFQRRTDWAWMDAKKKIWEIRIGTTSESGRELFYSLRYNNNHVYGPIPKLGTVLEEYRFRAKIVEDPILYKPSEKVFKPYYEYVELDKLQPSSINDFDSLGEAEFETLKSSIRKNGVWTPIICKPNGDIVAGENRWRACVQLRDEGVEHVQKISVMYFQSDMNADQEYDIMEMENLIRRHIPAAERKRRYLLRLERKYLDKILASGVGGDRKSANYKEKSGLIKEIADREGLGERTVRFYTMLIRKSHNDVVIPVEPEKQLLILREKRRKKQNELEYIDQQIRELEVANEEFADEGLSRVAPDH